MLLLLKGLLNTFFVLLIEMSQRVNTEQFVDFSVVNAYAELAPNED